MSVCGCSTYTAYNNEQRNKKRKKRFHDCFWKKKKCLLNWRQSKRIFLLRRRAVFGGRVTISHYIRIRASGFGENISQICITIYECYFYRCKLRIFEINKKYFFWCIFFVLQLSALTVLDVWSDKKRRAVLLLVCWFLQTGRSYGTLWLAHTVGRYFPRLSYCDIVFDSLLTLEQEPTYLLLRREIF